MESWMTSSTEASAVECTPQFPLFPLSKGFCVTVKRKLEKLKAVTQQSSSWYREFPVGKNAKNIYI